MIGIRTAIAGSLGGGGKSWASYWASQPEVLFFGLYSDISGGQMPNRKSGSSDYLTVAGTAGSETYQCPNTAPYITADTDYIWFKTDESQRTVTTAELIGYDLQRTPVKYEDESPNEIVAIIILNAAVTGTKRDNLFRDMWLSVWWDDSFCDYGHIKDNRGAGQQLWTPEAVISFYDTFTDIDATNLADHTPDIGGFTWIQSSANRYVISANKAIPNTTYSGILYCVFDSGKSDVDISVDITTPDDNYNNGIILRMNSASNYWKVLARRNTGESSDVGIKIYKDTNATSVVTEMVAHVTGTKTLRVVASGNYITVYWGGVKIIDSYETDGSYVTKTTHGITGYYTAPYVQVQFDNFKIV